jgi:uncharacterized membrane protein
MSHKTRGPTLPDGRGGLASTLARNIQALQERRAEEERTATVSERISGAITRFAGSISFVVLHLVLFGGWTLANLRIIPGVPAWDPSFIILATFASVEAIFLSTFVLITQNRMMAAADKRADLDLQINLLAEHEVTKLVTIVSAIARRLEVRTEADSEIGELTRDVAPEVVLDELETTAAKARDIAK